MPMLELSPENALSYLREQGWLGPDEPAEIESLGWGVSNVVLRVTTGRGRFVLKQSRPQLRTRDAWFSDLERVYREQEVMERLQPLLPPLTVPKVLFSDRERFVFAMEHAPEESKVWKESLLRGEIDQEVANRCGMILGRIHQLTAADTRLVESFGDHTVFVQLRVDPFYRRIQERRPEVADSVGEIVERMLATKEALCHADFSPKNILTHAQGFTLVDYETAHFGDPAMDLGFFLSHLLLKGVKWSSRRQEFLDLTRNFWSDYGAEVRFRPLAELQQRGIEHLAVCMLARIDGTSPVDYLPEESKRELVRRFCRRLFAEKPATWDEVVLLFDAQFRDRFPHH
ncbi:MAG: aminoglycoside phosphotransferase [Gemmatales bacterium]|nr:MAG: aminoglycoside phosphotransferase [Gemmatales bacterium]